MILRTLSIDGFGRFDGDFQLELSDGVALIVGENESGKSTILAAVGAILFGFRTEDERSVFAPYGTAVPRSGSLVIEANGERYRFSRDFASNRARIESLGDAGRILFEGSAKPGGRTEQKEAYDEWMRKLFGFESRELFLNSVFIEQNSLQPEIEGVVRQIVSGMSSADYSVALGNLKETYEELTVAVPWGRSAGRKPRRIETMEAGLSEKRRVLSDVRAAGTVIEESRDRLSSLQSQLAGVAHELADRRAHEQDLSGFSLALDRKKRLEGQLSACRKEMREIDALAEDLRKCGEEIENRYAGYRSFPAHAEADMATLVNLDANRTKLEERCRKVEGEAVRLELSRSLATGYAVAAMAAGLLVAGLGIAFAGGVARAVLILAGIALCAWPLISALLRMRSKRYAREGTLNEIREQLRSLNEQSADIERRYPDLRQKNLTDVIEELRQFTRLQREKERKEEALRQHPGAEEIDAKFNSLSNELLVAVRELEDLRSRRPSLGDIEKDERIGQAVEETRAGIHRLEEQRDRLSEERKNLEIRLARAEATETVSVERLEEEIAETESELDQLKRNRGAYLLAIRMLEEAISEFRSSHLARIEQKTSEYLTQITRTRCRVRLDEQLAPLGVEEAGRLFEPVQLSQGVRDQLHFALRLAAIEEVCSDIRLPIVMDDPFVNFDENRLKAALQMLDTLSESHQIVLLTHDRRYCDWRRPIRFLER